MQFSLPSLLLLGVLGSGVPPAEVVTPGDSRERTLAATETHVYRVEGTGSPLLLLVEQRGIDLVVEARGPGEDPVVADAPNNAWGPEVLVLPAGDREIEIRALHPHAAPGRYTLRLEALSRNAQEAAAWTALSRGGQLAARDPAQARSAYQEALEAWRVLGGRPGEAEALQALAALEDQKDLRSAAERHRAALALWRALDDPHRTAASLNRLGIVLQRAGEIEAARQAQDGALALWRDLGERVEEVGTRSEICLLEQTRGTLQEALACTNEVRAFFQELGDRREEARILNNLGGLHDLLGEPDAALAHYRQALALHQALGDRPREAATLNNIAVIHRTLGEWQEALRLFGQVRDLLTPLGNRPQTATLLNNIAFVYTRLEEPRRALPFLEDALKLRREVGDRRGELITRNNLGSTWRQLDDLAQALSQHRQALALALELGDPQQEAVTRLRIAEVELDRGETAGALREIDSALTSLRRAGTRHVEAQALQLRGRALQLAGRPRDALPVLREALEVQRSLRNRVGEAEVLHALAVLERTLGLREEARVHAEEAVARVEEVRTGFVDPDLRSAFLATQRRAYALVIDLLMDRHAADPAAGHDRAALQVSEQARARSLLDALLAGNAVPAGSAISPRLLERRRSLRHRLSARTGQRLRESGTPEKVEALEKEIEALLAELHGVEAEIQRQDPRYAALRQPRPLSPDEIAGLLDSGTLLLEYSLGEERSYLWVVGAGSFRSFVLPAQREIEELARRIYAEMSTVEAGSRRSAETAETLARHLLGPLWPDAAGLRRLVVVPDGALHHMPLDALPAPGSGTPLLDSHEVVYIPSATTLALQRQRLESRPRASRRAAVLADPVFSADDPRLPGPPPRRHGTGAGLHPSPAFERLPATRREAETIAALSPAGQVWTALDLAANREAVLAGGLRDYQVLHFATHGVADISRPELSGLVLSLVEADGRPREGFLGLPDIYELDLDADLVVLSGCRTAFGKEVRGEGLMGITRAFQYAGVPRVVAGLWRVQDRATAELMARFYRALWEQGASPAAALREARRSLRRDPRYRPPYFWAGFVLQGDWR